MAKFVCMDDIDDEIKALELEIDVLRLELSFANDDEQRSQINHAGQIKMVNEALNEKEKQKDILETQRYRMCEAAHGFEGVNNIIAKDKYIHGKSLIQIAMDHNYTEQYIYNKHSEIKKMLIFADKLKYFMR